MDIETCKQFNELWQEREQLRESLEIIQEKLDILGKRIEDDFVTDGIDKITVDGRTIFMSSQIWAKYGKNNREKVIEILKSNPQTAALVAEGFNSQRLSSFIRERINAGEELPPEFEGVIEYSELVSVKSTPG